MTNHKSLGFRAIVAALSTLLLVGCSSSASPPVSDPGTNDPPVISGSPALTVIQDQPYEFIPTASDPNQDVMTFLIENPPEWASFDAQTGTLSGTPTSGDIGISTAITIAVSDDTASASLTPFDLEVLEIPLGSATVSWDVPTTNADGSLLDDLAGFRVHYGSASNTYTQTKETLDISAVSLLIEDLEQGTYYFAVTAFDDNDNESALSTEVSKVVMP